MTRIFLSYASENSEDVTSLARDWRERGAEVFRFEDPANQGEIIVSETERRIDDADVFVVIMSPEYLLSRWCKRELGLAIAHENDVDGQFVYVVQVALTPHRKAGLLSAYSWIDARGVLTQARLDEIATALGLGARRPAGADPEFLGFRNRDDELAKLLSGLRTADGRELWVVVSPPLMGKSSILIKLEKALVNASPAWSVHRLDLRLQPVDVRYDPVLLVSALLQFDGSAEGLGADALQAIAREVGARPGPMLFILDGADLLGADCAAAARVALTAVRQIVRGTGKHKRFGLVIATRRHDEWRGLGPNARVGERFELLPLSEFDVGVVHQALLDESGDVRVEPSWSHAARLHRLSEGLPALLARSVQWALATGLENIEDADGPAAFDGVARGYIQKDLLAAESLLPTGADRMEPALAVLRGALRVLSTYRLYTQTHLAFHLAADPALRESMTAAGWTPDDLWEALGRTALQSNQNAHEIWHEIEPSLRRLLHRYHHRTAVERATAHSTARRFYGGWTENEAAGREQQVVLVECLWHEACRLMAEQPEAVADLLPGIAVELARACGHGPMYRPAEYRRAVARRLAADEELEVLLMNHDGLFSTIIEAVPRSIGDDG